MVIGKHWQRSLLCIRILCPFNADDLSVVRKHLSTKLPDVKRSHLAEAVAASLGFNTSIALRTAIRGNPANEKRYGRFDFDAFLNRLTLLGYESEPTVRRTFFDVDFPREVALEFALCWGGILQAEHSTQYVAADLLRSPNVEQVKWAKEILSGVKTFRSTPNTESSSYELKHCIERKFRSYLTNGAFIQAAVELGFTVDVPEDGPNVFLYVDTSELERAVDVAYAAAVVEYERVQAEKIEAGSTAS